MNYFIYTSDPAMIVLHDYGDVIVDAEFFFPFTLESKASVFKLLRFEERFRKAPVGLTIQIKLRLKYLRRSVNRPLSHGSHFES